MRTHFKWMVIIAALFASSAIAAPVTGEAEEASAFIHSLSTRVLEITKTNNSIVQKKTALIPIFDEVIDIQKIGRFVLGVQWRSASEAQRKAYLTAYRAYLINTYLPKLMDYSDPKLVIKRAYKQDEDFIVETEVVSPAEEAPIAVDYKMRANGGKGKFKIYDVVAEGISLAATQRADFSAAIAQSSLDSLIEKLNEKAKQPEAESSIAGAKKQKRRQEIGE